MPGVDGATIAADGVGNVLVFWHVFDPPQEDVPNGHWIYLSRSTDQGTHFATAERVRIAKVKDLAGSMCMMRARIGDDRHHVSGKNQCIQTLLRKVTTAKTDWSLDRPGQA